MLILVEGPAGGGKSGLAREMREAGEIDLIADNTALWVAMTGVQRGTDGRYPVRLDSDLGLHAARYLQATAVSFGLREGMRVAVTTSQRNQAERWGGLAAQHSTPFSIRTVDPGREIVTARLSDPVTGVLSDECDTAISRWFK